MIDIECLRRHNFKPKEFVQSNIARMEGINNLITDPIVLANMVISANKAQEFRNFLKYPMTDVSGYRCLQLNRFIGSKDTSQHILGQAFDFQCWGFGEPEKIVKAIMEAGIIVDQCLAENGWVHTSIKPSYMKNRNEFGSYIKGKKTLFKKSKLFWV